jgi:HAE1 family hydrophobic/amphiphilic exporter-1
MFLAKVSITRPVLTTVGILVFIIFGAIGFYSLNLNLFPDVEIPYVTVQTIYPGAGPKEVETLISKKIEDAVSTISQIDRVESYSLDGASIVILQFTLGKKVDIANQEVKDKVDAILTQLPDDIEKPIIQKIDFKAFPVMDIILSGNLDPRQLYEIADKTLKDRFSQISGVANINISGGQEREIQVKLDSRS